MIDLPGFVLIDDNENELKDILNSFVGAGIPCVPIQYINDDPDNNPTGLDHVELDHLKPRVIITDLNLLEHQNIEAATLVGPVARVIQKLIDTGPYILYFWSKNPTLVDEVMALLESRFKDKLKLPIHWGVMDKKEYKGNVPALKEKIKSIIKENPVFYALFDWENRVAQAAIATTNALYSLNVPSAQDGVVYKDSHNTELQKLFALIGNKTLGDDNALENPELAVELGLSPVLNDQLQQMSDIQGKGKWFAAAPNIGTKIEIEPSLKANLNSFYHIEQVSSEYPKSCRGIFLEIAQPILNDPDHKSKLESRLGSDIDKILEDEFLGMIVKAGKMNDVKAATRLGFIEVSAECDQAQKKTKLHRYILGALTPIVYEGFNLYGKPKKSHDGIYRVPDVTIDEVDYILQLTFKYQIGSIPSENTWFGNARFRLRDQIMSDVTFRCAQHLSRPGIIEFH